MKILKGQFEIKLPESEVAQSCLTLCDHMDYSLPDSSVHGIFFRQGNWSGLPFPSPGDLPNPGIEPGSPALQADALLSEPPGKPKLHTLWQIVNFNQTLIFILISNTGMNS